MSEFDEDIYNLVNLIFWSEEIKILPYSPNVLKEQANVYVEARWAVVSHRSKIRYLRDKEEKSKQDSRNRKSKTLNKR